MRKIFASIVALVMLASLSQAEETLSESAKASGNTAVRKIKKGGNRLKEAICMEGDLKCAAEKAKHRAHEAGEAMGDKAKEVKDKVD